MAALAWADLAFDAGLLAAVCGGRIPPSTEFWPGTLDLFAAWNLMAVAMMLPAVAPAAVRMAGGAGSVGARALAAAGFTIAYLFVWSLFALAVALVLSLAALLLPASGLSASTTRALSGAALVAAGLYQFGRTKAWSILRCGAHAPRDGSKSARAGVERGLSYGAACVACCAPLMLLPLAVGSFSLEAMATLSALIFAERAWPFRLVIARAIGSGLAAWGLAVLAGYA